MNIPRILTVSAETCQHSQVGSISSIAACANCCSNGADNWPNDHFFKKKCARALGLSAGAGILECNNIWRCPKPRDRFAGGCSDEEEAAIAEADINLDEHQAEFEQSWLCVLRWIVEWVGLE